MAFFPLEKIKKYLKKERQYAKTFSQTGEDCIVAFIANSIGLLSLSYIDIGAYRPFYLNNTARFYIEGAHGINIEPNPVAYGELKKLRKRDINLNIGIAKEKGTLTYYVMDQPTLNTFSEIEAMRTVEKQGGKIIDRLHVNVDTIDNILNTYCNGICPDFMNIDIEGGEECILNSIPSFQVKPKIICVETVEYSTAGMPRKSLEAKAILQHCGYFLFADTCINSIFVQQELWEQRSGHCNEPSC